MAEIYSDLPSPLVDLSKPGPHPDALLARDIIDHRKVQGLRSLLYRYQQDTVAAMIEREINPRNAPDPHFIPLTGMDGKVFYFQPARMEVLRERPVVTQNRGGVLCEELGKEYVCMRTSGTALTLATCNPQARGRQ